MGGRRSINKGLHVDVDAAEAKGMKERRRRGGRGRVRARSLARARDEERNSYCLASPAFPQYTAQVYRMCTLSPLLLHALCPLLSCPSLPFVSSHLPIARPRSRRVEAPLSHARSVPYPVSRGSTSPPLPRLRPPSPRPPRKSRALASFWQNELDSVDLYERAKERRKRAPFL